MTSPSLIEAPREPERLLLILSAVPEVIARVRSVALRQGFAPRAIRHEELVGEPGQRWAEDGAILLLDLRMGGSIGAGTLASLRCDLRFATLPILALAGDREDSAIRDALSAGADDFLRESFVERELPLKLHLLRRAWETREELVHRENDLRTLLSLIHAFAGAADTTSLLEAVGRRLASELSLERCSLVLTDAAGRSGTVVAASDAPGMPGHRLDLLGYPEILEAIRTRKPVILEDAKRHPLLDPVKEAITAAGLGALAVFPLFLEDELLGVLVLRTRASTFSSREVDFVAAVSHATALALRNARSMSAIRERVDEAEARGKDLRQFEEIYKQHGDGIALVDASSHRLISINPAARQIFGMREKQEAGLPFGRIASFRNREEASRLIDLAAKGHAPRAIVLEAQRGETQVHLEVVATILRDGVVLLSIRDITEKKHLESQLFDQQENAAKSAMIVELAGAAAHELNQPLTVVLGYAELLAKRLGEEAAPVSRHVALLHREAERMAQIVKKIGGIMRYETSDYIAGSRIVDLDRASHVEGEPT